MVLRFVDGSKLGVIIKVIEIKLRLKNGCDYLVCFVEI